MGHSLKLFINGEWISSSSGKTFDVLDPATGEVVGVAESATEGEVSQAIEAAHAAFKVWSRMTPPERGKILKKAAGLAHQRADELGRLLTLEQGKPLKEAIGEIKASADALEFFGEEGWRIEGDLMPPNKPNRRDFVLKQPLGVVVAISSWNYPVLLMTWKLGPALVTGNTVVAKPPTETPLAVSLFAALLAEAGAPPGTINIITGRGSVLGPSLIQHPLTAKVAITGQSDTGKKVMEWASRGLKQVSLELGGHTPLIVFQDADLEKAVEGGVLRSFRNMGQICNAVNRIYVQNTVLDRYVELFVKGTQKLTIDHGLKDPDLGPMCTRAGIEKTRTHIEDAVANGAKVLHGGKPPAGKKYERGLFFEPTILVNVNHEMLVMREETFGPVAPIMGFDTVDEAITLANDSPFGLVAYVYSNDLRTVLRASEELECGTVGVNNVAGGEFPYPYTGWKQSGLGVENSRYATEGYLHLKHVRLEL
ncbi:MAG: NAD-dependent succinate-semialdehyde dehydrogenase [Chloroflexi bacterium RBG_13_68_17]|nr:MAG: NAD-dependent succinate-semialdehyde dehydrogenase [Chloroflexi bacterium RBG_13_68_17]